MNPESLKSELQQVFDTDLALRKEFTELRRSLSDYRNQLIMRDEDCQRLQVNIDVLNTKLMVMERDNASQKAEIQGLREAQGVLTAELAARQKELEIRESEIAALRADLGQLTGEYERKAAEMEDDAGRQLMRMREQYNEEVLALREQSLASEEAMRGHFEQQIADLDHQWQERLRLLDGDREAALGQLREQHAGEMAGLREQYNATLASLSATSHEQQAELKARYEATIAGLEERLNVSQGDILMRHDEELARLRASSDDDRAALAHQFDLNLEAIAAEYADRETRARAGYEARIADLKSELAATTEELTLNLEQRLAAIRSAHEETLLETNRACENRIAELTNQYEERIANLLIHSNASNSRLSEELELARAGAEELTAVLADLNAQIEARDQDISLLTERVGELEMQLFNEKQKTENILQLEASVGPETADPDEVAVLREEMARQNHVHSDYVNELNGQISVLTDEIQNMTSVFVGLSNDLGAAETTIGDQAEDLRQARLRITELEAAAAERSEWVSGETVKDLEARLALKELAYNKLLAENEGLIAEIEEAQRQTGLRSEELSLVRSELEERQNAFAARAAELNETLEMKNRQLELEQSKSAALEKDLSMARQDLADLSAAVSCGVNDSARREVERLTSELESLRGMHPADQDSVLAGLREQVETLNAANLSLLEDKDQMASQLLRLNAVVSDMSQQVDPEQINVTGLNNERRNAILAANSSEGQDFNASMKKQINELVREIDKCIALLSA